MSLTHLPPLRAPRPGTPQQQVPAPQHGPARSNAEQAALLGLDGQEQEPLPEYVDMTEGQKTQHLVGLLGSERSQGLLGANGLNQTDESMLAAIMVNEGGRNERRRSLSQSWQRRAGRLSKRLGVADNAGIAALTDKQLAGLNEEDRALVDAARAGRVDLGAFLSGPGRSDEQKQAYTQATDALTQVGIDHQVAMFDEMTGLQGKDERSKPEESRLATLRAKQLHGEGTLGDVNGLSSGRFREIYDEGQSRFEVSHYKRYKRKLDNYKKRVAAGNPKSSESIGPGSETVQDFAGRHPELMQDGANMDLLADLSTSYGTAQVLGYWGDKGTIKANDASGQEQSVGLDALKASGQRLTPNEDDVMIQLGFLKGVAGLDSLSNARTVGEAYNGSGVSNAYVRGLRDRSATYRATRDRTRR